MVAPAPTLIDSLRRLGLAQNFDKYAHGIILDVVLRP